MTQLSVMFPFKQEDFLDFSGSLLLSSTFAPLQVKALMGNLLRLREEDSSIKCLVVSQFTRFLSILEVPLRSETRAHVSVSRNAVEQSFFFSFNSAGNTASVLCVWTAPWAKRRGPKSSRSFRVLRHTALPSCCCHSKPEGWGLT